MGIPRMSRYAIDSHTYLLSTDLRGSSGYHRVGVVLLWDPPRGEALEI